MAISSHIYSSKFKKPDYRCFSWLILNCLMYDCKCPKSKKVYGTFGLGWKYRERIVIYLKWLLLTTSLEKWVFCKNNQKDEKKQKRPSCPRDCDMDPRAHPDRRVDNHPHNLFLGWVHPNLHQKISKVPWLLREPEKKIWKWLKPITDTQKTI